MFSQFFGNYLLKNGLVTAEQLREVLALQDTVRVKLGILAIDAGFMTAEQVERTNQLQAQVDKRFGEIAIEEGYMTEEQLSELLGKQSNRHLLLSQAFIDKEIFSFEQIGKILDDYRNDSGMDEREFEALKNNDVDVVTKSIVRMPELAEPQVYMDYFTLFVRNLVRFIDDNIFLEPAEQLKEEPFEALIHSEMEGRYRIFTGFSGPKEGMAEFGRRFAKMDVDGLDEVARDSLGEFMNTQNGLFLSNLSNQWVELELNPSEFREDGVIKSIGVVYKIPFTLPFGKFVFYLGVGSPVFK